MTREVVRLPASHAELAPASLGAPWRAQDLMDELAHRLEGAVAGEARDEARDLIAALLDESRFWAVLHPDALLSVDVVTRAFQAAAARVNGAPFAYAVGRAAFRYLTLRVDPSVLIPRQETELLVDLVLAATAGRPRGAVADVGTGSGAIALALATEGAFERVIATDVSADALAVARENASRLGPALRAPVEFRGGDGLAPLAGEMLDVLVSNPPYIAYDEAAALPRTVRDWEPAHALLSGQGGLDMTGRLLRDARSVVRAGGLIALEVDSRRAQVAARLATDAGWRAVTVHRDLAGRERFLLGTRA